MLLVNLEHKSLLCGIPTHGMYLSTEDSVTLIYTGACIWARKSGFHLLFVPQILDKSYLFGSKILVEIPFIWQKNLVANPFYLYQIFWGEILFICTKNTWVKPYFLHENIWNYYYFWHTIDYNLSISWKKILTHENLK